MSNNGLKERLKMSAKADRTKFEAMIVLAGNNDLGCEVHIGGLEAGISQNKLIIPVLKKEIAEIDKFLAGKANTWK